MGEGRQIRVWFGMIHKWIGVGSIINYILQKFIFHLLSLLTLCANMFITTMLYEFVGVTVVTGKWEYSESNKSRFVMDKSLLGSNKG